MKIEVYTSKTGHICINQNSWVLALSQKEAAKVMRAIKRRIKKQK